MTERITTVGGPEGRPPFVRAGEEEGRPPLVRATSRCHPYAPVALGMLGVLAVSQALPMAKRAFGGNVPPLYAVLSPRAGPVLVPAVALAAGTWWIWPRVLRLPTWAYLTVAVGVAFGLAVVIALIRGPDDLAASLRGPLGYQASVAFVDRLGPHSFVERFTSLAPRLSLHARTHPPGPVLFLWAASALLRGNLTAVGLSITLIGSLAAVPVYFFARAMYGFRTARIAVALFITVPGVLLFSATSLDAVFMTVSAVALMALARMPHSRGWAVAAGAAVALALNFTFGALALVPVGAGLAVVAARWGDTGRARGAVAGSSAAARPAAVARRCVVAVVALVGAVAALRLAGLDLVAVFRATLGAHLSDPSRQRSYLYWVLADIPAFLIVAGVPQTALFGIRTSTMLAQRTPGVEAVLLVTLAGASLSGLFLGEVDHIWLFLLPMLVAPSAAALSDQARGGSLAVRGAMAVALAQTLLMEVLLWTYW
jgi:hypothetical protein